MLSDDDIKSAISTSTGWPVERINVDTNRSKKRTTVVSYVTFVDYSSGVALKTSLAVAFAALFALLA